MSGKKRSFWNLADRIEGDKVVWIIVLMLILLSVICLFSSTSRLLEDGQTRLDIVKNQLVVVAAGFGIIVLLYSIRSIGFFRALSKFGFLVSMALLLILDLHKPLGPFRPIMLNSAYRILQIGGLQLHVFEVVKVAMVMYLAWAMDALKRGEIKRPQNLLLRKTLYIYAPFVLTVVAIIPGSNSSALFIGGIMFIVILLGGGNFKDMSVLAAAMIVILAGCYGLYKVSDGKVMNRIGTGISRIMVPENWEDSLYNARQYSHEYYTALDHLRQPYSAKIAVKEGGLLGKGPGQSTQRYVVPDISEDYMFSFIIEEYGLLGGIIVIFLYVSLLARSALIVRNCGSDHFAKLAVAGLSLFIVGQAFLHMMVNVDIGPMTGQTLPLVSHGNSAFLCFCIAFGLILSISRIASARMAREQKNAEPLIKKTEEDELRQA